MLTVVCRAALRVDGAFKVRDGIASTLECDLCINNVLACHNTELIYAFTMLDWRVRPLVYCIKLW